MRWILAAAVKYATNHVIHRLPSHRVRQALYRHVLCWHIEPDVTILMGQHIQMSGVRSSGKRVFIGKGTVINQGCLLYTTGGIVIGKNVSISAGVCLLTGTHDINHPQFIGIAKPIVIEDNVRIGARAIIICGVTIGEGAVIMEGALVIRNVPPYTVVGGVPARVVSQPKLQGPSLLIEFSAALK